MTREEAIEMVKTAFETWENEYDTGNDWNKEHEARDMAIKALEQEPCEDCISRQAVIDLVEAEAVNPQDGTQEWRTYVNDTVESIWREVRSLPSVTPQQKTGHWIEEFNDLEGEVRFTCSSCGKYQLFGTDYCYNCGAKMIDIQESENKE